jgi:pilus assembly protein CpaE
MEQENETVLNILVIAKYDPTFDWIQLSLQEQHYNIVGLVESVDQVWPMLKKQARIDIIVADTSGGGVHNTVWIRQAMIQSSGTLVLVIATSQEMDFVSESMLAGAQAFLLKPFDLSELARSIEQVHQLWLQRQTLMVEAHSQEAAKTSHSVAVFSPKGGTGVTTLAVNLAVAMKQLTDAPILLVDTDLHTADVDILLNVFSKLSLLDLLHVDQSIDRELLEQVAAEQVGLTVLVGDPRLQFIEAPVEPGQMGELMQQLMSVWEGYIIVSTSNGLDRWTVEILDVVETVLLVTTPHLSALRAVRNFLEMAEVHEDPGGKWLVIMNAYQSQKALQMSDIESSIHYPITTTIDYDANLITTAINSGVPLTVSNSNSAIAQEIFALAEQILENSPLSEALQEDAGQAPAANEKRVGQSRQSGRRFWRFFSRGSVRSSNNA